MNEVNHIYIHFPFCRSKCSYCAFFSEKIKRTQLLLYKKSIQKYISFFKSRYIIKPITIYIGGGTPSLNDGKYLKVINDIIKKNFDLSCIKEYTVELNPVDISIKLINILKNTPINRVSIGVQSFNRNTLRLFNRKSIDFKRLTMYLNLLKFNRINTSIDLINYLPGDRIDINLKKLKYLLKYKLINHISVYDLIFEPDTIIYNKKDRISLLTQDKYLKSLEKIFKQYSFKKYEVSNYSLEGNEAIHNYGYWLVKNFIGIGQGAYSKVNSKRYICNSDLNNTKLTIERITKIDLIKEYLLMRIRVINPINKLYFNDRFNCNFDEVFAKTIYKNIELKNIKNHKTHLILTKRGMRLINSILVDLFIDIEDYFDR